MEFKTHFSIILEIVGRIEMGRRSSIEGFLFLGIGVTLAIFHLDGTVLCWIERHIIWQIGGPNSGEASERSRGERPSLPGALFNFKFFSSFTIAGTDISGDQSSELSEFRDDSNVAQFGEEEKFLQNSSLIFFCSLG